MRRKILRKILGKFGESFFFFFFLNFEFRPYGKLSVATLTLGSQPRQGLARLRAKRKPESEGKCEGMNPHTPKRVSTLRVWSPGGLLNF
jgi:hypothetical protein